MRFESYESATRSSVRARALALSLLALAVCSSPARGAGPTVSGVSVSTRWSGDNDLQYGGYGEIWRHQITQGKVVDHAKLFDGPARNPVISPDGKRVAFIRQDGMIVVMALESQEAPRITELAQTHPEAHLDWPLGDWVYFNLGGYHQYGTSRLLRRVNARTGVDEPAVTFDRGTWRFAISSDLRRAVVRTDDEKVEPWGRIVAYDMLDGAGQLKLTRATDRYSCSLGLDPSGTYFLDGWMVLHDGMDIRRWDTLEVVGGFTHEQAAGWGGPDSGTGHNLNNWSVNSQKWISVQLGWGFWGSEGANQVLYNLIDRQRIVVTDNGPGIHIFDSSGDFWVADAEPTAGELMPPTIQRNPEPRRVALGQQATFSVSASSADSQATSYQWLRDGEPINGAIEASYTTPATTIIDHGARFGCRVRNQHGEALSEVAELEVHPEGELVNIAPKVNAGLDARAPLGRPFLLVGSVIDDGLPALITPSFVWEQVQGPEGANVARPSSARTLVSVDLPGHYRFKLTVDDGELSASAEVNILVVEERSIRLLTPNGGEVWQVGSTHEIRWDTEGVEDVAIQLSLDDGKTWETIVPSIDTSSPEWGSYRWTVPDRPSKRCRVAVTSYDDASNNTRSAAAFEIRREPAPAPLGGAGERDSLDNSNKEEPGGCGLGSEQPRGWPGWPVLLLLALVWRCRDPLS